MSGFPPQIAAFIAEPVMGAGGVIPPPATYFEKVSSFIMKFLKVKVCKSKTFLV